MTISTPPTAPNPADPSTFNARATAWVAWWLSAIPEINALSGMTNSGQFLDGTGALPGIAFASDPDTGLARPGANQIGFSTNGTQRVLLTTTALTVNVPIGGTAVQSSDTDTTAGRLMPIGAFGLGDVAATPTMAAIDSTTTPVGWWSYTTGATGTFPAGVTAAAGGSIFMARESATKGWMMLQPAGSKLLYFRNLSTTWGAWQTVASAETAGTAGQVLRTNPTATGAEWGSSVTPGTAVASTSGTSIDFTAIPAWARRVTILFNGVSTNGTDPVLVQLGDSGGIETTGYLGSASSVSSGGAIAVATPSSGFQIGAGSQAATFVRHGSIRLELLGSNIWECTGSLGQSDIAQILSAAGGKTLSGALDRVRITTVGGTDTFDAGSINVLWE